MVIKGLVDEDFVNYKKPSMFISFPKCSWKCEKECGVRCCQNGALAREKDIDIDIDYIVQRYIENPITSAVVCGGLEPFDSWEDLENFIKTLRKYTNNECVIYTGYREDELIDKVSKLKKFDNIIIKYGRYLPNGVPKFDRMLGVTLSSENQYAVKIS